MTEVDIKTAKNMRSGIDVRGIVINKEKPRTVNLKSGGTVDVCNATIEDASDKMILALWVEDIQKVQIGSKVTVKNAYTNQFKDQLTLQKGKFGILEVE